MKGFIDKTVKPFLVIAGLGTCTAGIYGFLPKFAVENISKMPFDKDYAIFVQHWGLMVLLAGIFMIITAFNVAWRLPILLFAAIEKACFVILYLVYTPQPFAAGFKGAAIMDAIIVVYLLLYFRSLRET
ncbi:MAG TPA: hypothetical protein VMU29_10465 [Smithella sp.]|nr:hypothetical protein [Smithella sp.]